MQIAAEAAWPVPTLFFFCYGQWYVDSCASFFRSAGSGSRAQPAALMASRIWMLTMLVVMAMLEIEQRGIEAVVISLQCRD